jgi:hypothetical protein
MTRHRWVRVALVVVAVLLVLGAGALFREWQDNTRRRQVIEQTAHEVRRERERGQRCQQLAHGPIQRKHLRNPGGIVQQCDCDTRDCCKCY